MTYTNKDNCSSKISIDYTIKETAGTLEHECAHSKKEACPIYFNFKAYLIKGYLSVIWK
jgi:hypothetical protein